MSDNKRTLTLKSCAVRGPKGEDGAVTQTDFDELEARVAALENLVDADEEEY